jgi:exonuclease III
MDELICMLHSCDLSPHIICLTKHYLKEQNLIMMKPNNYYLASKFARQTHTEGGVRMYMKINLESTVLDRTEYCIEKVIEVCAAQIEVGNHFIISLCIYRSPSGNFGEFVVQVDQILKYLCKPKFEFVICGDFNVIF